MVKITARIPVPLGHLTFHICHGRTEIKMEDVSIGGQQCRDGFNAGLFSLGNPLLYFTNMYNFDVFLTDKAYDVLFRAEANRTTCMIEDRFAHFFKVLN